MLRCSLRSIELIFTQRYRVRIVAVPLKVAKRSDRERWTRYGHFGGHDDRQSSLLLLLFLGKIGHRKVRYM